MKAGAVTVAAQRGMPACQLGVGRLAEAQIGYEDIRRRGEVAEQLAPQVAQPAVGANICIAMQPRPGPKNPSDAGNR
jgi:hypothetical protein